MKVLLGLGLSVPIHWGLLTKQAKHVSVPSSTEKHVAVDGVSEKCKEISSQQMRKLRPER